MAGRRFTAADGWKEGDPAPADAFRALGDDRATPVGPVLETHPGGYARRVVARGETVTSEMLAELRGAPAAEPDEQAASSSKDEG
jgi:hypothetical protein